MAARQIVVPGAMPSRDRNGRAMPGKLRFYEPDTAFSTPAVIYTDNTLTTPHAFPILSDAAGRWPAMWADDADSFDVAWSDLANDGPQGQWTDLSPADDAVLASVSLAQTAADEAEAALAATQAIADTLAGYTGDINSALNVDVTRAGTGAVLRSVKAKLDDWVSVKDFGAIGDQATDDRSAIQAAIDYCAAGALVGNNMNPAAPGRTLYFPPGIYRVSSTLTLRKGVILQGSGVFATQIFLSNGANVDVIKTENFDALNGSTDGWLEAGVPCMFGIRDLVVYGNKFNNTSGNGVSIYGYAYDICNVIIADCAARGLYSNRAHAPADTFTRNFYKLIETTIYDLKIWNCDGHGLYYAGPTDAKIDGVFIGECGQLAAGTGQIGAWLDAPMEVGLLHVYACGKADGTNNPIGIVISDTVRAETLITESNYGEGLRVSSFYAEVASLQAYGNCRTYGTRAINVEAGASYFSCGYAEVKLNAVNHGGILVEGPHAKFSRVNIIGTDADLTIYTGAGFEQASTAHYLDIGSLTVKDLRGVGAVGAKFNTGGATKSSKIRADLIGCTSGANPGSGFSHGASVAITIEKATAGQAYSTAAFPAVAFGAQVITQISEVGAGSYG